MVGTDLMYSPFEAQILVAFLLFVNVNSWKRRWLTMKMCHCNTYTDKTIVCIRWVNAAYTLWKTLLPWTPSGPTPLVRCPPAPHRWLSGPAPACWSLMPSTDTPDSQTCAGRTRPPAGPATETGAPHSEKHKRGRNSKQSNSETTMQVTHRQHMGNGCRWTVLI